MKPMTTFLLRISIPMNEELDAIVTDLWCTKSHFIRQSIQRNLDVVRTVEMPLLRQYHREVTAKQLKVLTSISKERKE